MAKILVVDDNQDLRELFSLILQMNGYEVGMAYNKEHAMSLIENSHPDLVLLDVLLRNENGRDICKEIKKRDKKIPIILVSGNPKLLANYEECEADGVLEKPFDINTINSKIQLALNTYSFK